jgi:glutathione S-transferase
MVCAADISETELKPRLYSFRRCPYAIRARLAITVAGIDVEKIDIELKDKPPEMLAISPKGTVPVLQLPDGRVLDESLDIMLWALSIHDPQQWLQGRGETLVAHNDDEFKYFLDRYKYADRYTEFSLDYYREKATKFIADLDLLLNEHQFLIDNQTRFADMAIFPFVRQFAQVDKDWFYHSHYSAVIRWLDMMLTSELFISVMRK